MAQKRWLGLLGLLIAFPCFAADISDQDPRGTETVVIQRHSSRWNYPTEIVLQSHQTLHIVERGDTLWDLGQKYLGSPFAWPQIWEQNRWILDPHWIYPGDPLIVLTGTSLVDDGLGPVDEIDNLIPGTGLRLDSAPLSWVKYTYNFQDYLQLPYLVPQGSNAHFRELGAVRITGTQKEDRSNLSSGDVVYLEGGRAKGHQPGDRMMVLKVAKTRLIHPEDTLALHPLGDVVQHAAILRILSVHPRGSEAVVEDTLDGIEVGDYATTYLEPALILTQDVQIRDDIHEPIPTKTTAKIVYGRNGASFISNGSLVLIDKGTRSGFKVGDTLVCLRPKSLINEGHAQFHDDGQQTNRYLGQMVIVRADANSATCLIIATRTEMALGDTVTN